MLFERTIFAGFHSTHVSEMFLFKRHTSGKAPVSSLTSHSVSRTTLLLQALLLFDDLRKLIPVSCLVGILLQMLPVQHVFHLVKHFRKALIRSRQEKQKSFLSYRGAQSLPGSFRYLSVRSRFWLDSLNFLFTELPSRTLVGIVYFYFIIFRKAL